MLIGLSSADCVTKSSETELRDRTILPSPLVTQSASQRRPSAATNPVPVLNAPLPVVPGSFCQDSWTWDLLNRSPQVSLRSAAATCGVEVDVSAGHRHQLDSNLRHTVAVFHPLWSSGTAAVLGTKPLDNDSVHYWEVISIILLNLPAVL